MANNLLLKIILGTLVTIRLLCPAFASGQILFEGGPSFYDLIYESPLAQEGQPVATLSPKARAHKNIGDWMDVYQQKGVNLFSISLLDLEGVVICNSAILKNAGFRYIQDLEDIFPWILQAADKRKLSLSISLDNIFHMFQGSKSYKEWLEPAKLTPEAVGEIVRELGEYAKIYGVPLYINEAAAGAPYREAIGKACRLAGLQYVRYWGDWEGKSTLFCSEDYATYPIAPETNPEDALYLYSLAKWGAAASRLGHLNLMFGRAWVLGKKTGVATAGGWGLMPGCQQNVAIYRAVQWAPTLYCFYSATYDEKPYGNAADAMFVQTYQYEKNLRPWLQQLARKPDDSPKPIANLILDTPDPPFDHRGTEIFDNALMSSSEAITNAIGAAGFDLAVSIREPIPHARLYYIFTAGSSPQLDLYRDLSPQILPIFSQQGALVFLQCALGLPRGPNWRKIAPSMGLPQEIPPLTATGNISPIPAYATLPMPTSATTVSLPFRGYHFWINKLEDAGKLCLYDHISPLPVQDLDSDVTLIAAGTAKDKPIPLITRRKNCFFVNGNFVHFLVSGVLCNLMAPAPVFYKPAPVYLTTGKERCAIFAAADTTLDLQLPATGQIFHWSATGSFYPQSSLHWSGNRLQGEIKRWELVVVVASAR